MAWLYHNGPAETNLTYPNSFADWEAPMVLGIMHVS